MTFRNKSLNYNLQTTKSATKLQIISPNIQNLLKLINEKKSVEITNVILEEEQKDEKSILRVYTNDEILSKINEFHSKMFYSNLNWIDQLLILKKINKKYLDFIDEYSINTLFLVIGFLKWKDSTDSDEIFYSPLAFVQTKLISKNTNKNFYCSFDEESILTPNFTLLSKLQFNYGIKFDFDEFDQLENDIDKFNFIKAFLENNFQDNQWDFVDNVYLDTFSFSKINMYADLEQNEQKITENEFIKSISNEEVETKVYDLITEFNVENKIDINEYYHILDSDSSQEVAIQSAIQGESFILQGPPGTGKSHTITNIITELLARNKKILFCIRKKGCFRCCL
nr:DUF4011 domain-containing protein [Mycoplasma miroungirhinis]